MHGAHRPAQAVRLRAAASTTSSRTSTCGSRLDRYRAGTCLDYASASRPDVLAAALVAELGRDVDYLAVETDGAARAARMLADLL